MGALGVGVVAGADVDGSAEGVGAADVAGVAIIGGSVGAVPSHQLPPSIATPTMAATGDSARTGADERRMASTPAAISAPSPARNRISQPGEVMAIRATHSTAMTTTHSRRPRNSAFTNVPAQDGGGCRQPSWAASNARVQVQG